MIWAAGQIVPQSCNEVIPKQDQSLFIAAVLRDITDNLQEMATDAVFVRHA